MTKLGESVSLKLPYSKLWDAKRICNMVTENTVSAFGKDRFLMDIPWEQIDRDDMLKGVLDE